MADWDDEEFELDDNKLEGPRYVLINNSRYIIIFVLKLK